MSLGETWEEFLDKKQDLKKERNNKREKGEREVKREQDDTWEGGREYFRGIGGGGTSSLPLPVRG